MLSKNSNDITYLEIMLHNGAKINPTTHKFDFSIEAFKTLMKYGQFDAAAHMEFNEKQLFTVLDQDTILAYLIMLEKRTDYFNMYNILNVRDNYKVLLLLSDYNALKYVQYLPDSIFQALEEENIQQNATKLEDILEYNPDMAKYVIPKINNQNFLIKIFNKTHNFEILKNMNEKCLSCVQPGGEMVFETIIDLGVQLQFPRKKEFIEILIKNKKTNILNNIPENLLTESYDETRTYLDILNESGCLENMMINVTNEKTLQLLISKNLLTTPALNITPEVLCQSEYIDGEFIDNVDTLINNKVNFKATSWNNYICNKLLETNYLSALPNNITISNLFSSYSYDLFLNKVKTRELKYDLNKIKETATSQADLAYFLIELGKQNMIQYIDFIQPMEYLIEKNGQVLLNELLNMNPQLTYDTILRDTKTFPAIAAILKTRGFEVEDINITGYDKIETNDYIKDAELRQNLTGPLLPSDQDNLNQLYDLFINDGRSDPTLITNLITGYRNGLIQCGSVCSSEVENLIKIKKNNYENFCYILDLECSYFSPSTKEIHSKSSIETLMHETGHALHKFLANDATPNGYEELKAKLREDPTTLDKLTKFRKEAKEATNECSIIAQQMVDNVGFTKEDSFFKKHLLSMDAEDQMYKLNDILPYMDVDKEIISDMLKEMFTLEDYNNRKKKIIESEVKDNILRNKYGYLTSISDVFDAIYEGRFRAESLTDSNGEIIEGWYGHGIPYYSNPNHGFDELVAEFAAIFKGDNASVALNKFQEYLGDELFNMISNFYYNNITCAKYEITNNYENDNSNYSR